MILVSKFKSCISKLLFILILAFTFGACQHHCTKVASTRSIPDLVEYQLSGNVKQVSEYRYKATATDSGLVKTGVCAHVYSRFNESGFLIDEVMYDSTGSAARRIENIYDPTDLKVIETHFYDSNDNLIKTSGYEYDRAGNLITQIDYDGYNKRLEQMVNNYDEQNHLVLKSGFTASGYPMGWSLFHNDEKGNMIEEQEFNEDGELIKIYQLQRDDYGRIIEGVTYDADRNPIFAHSNEYDQYGNLTAWLADEQTELYSYNYDHSHNWIRKEIHYTDGNAKYIIERDIIYY